MSDDAASDSFPIPRRSWLILALIAAAFLLIRLPVMYRQPGGQDEDLFAVPGWTVLQEGVPRVPYAPSRNREGVLYKADTILFTLPPGYFYWQAPFYSVLGPGYGTARLASTAAGLMTVWLVYWLARQFYADERTALLAAGLYSLSRLFFFPCLFARPDMLCGFFGVAAVACGWRWHRGGRAGWIAAAGAMIGLGMLTHPFAIVYAMQLGLWVLFGRGSWKRRVGSSALLVAVSLLLFALWLPLILMHPEVFRAQFFNNVVNRAGPGLLERILFPAEAFRHQGALFLEHAGPWQVLMIVAGLMAATIHDLRASVRRRSGRLAAVVLAWSAVYLLVACQGTHVTKGYWCYPGAFLLICVSRATVLGAAWVGQLTLRPGLAFGAVVTLLTALMLPGAGLRTTFANVRHWSDPAYDRRAFVPLVLRDIPRAQVHLVDPAYVFDVYLTGRPTLLATVDEFYFGAIGSSYDVLIASRYDLERDIPELTKGRLVRSHGIEADPFACYAEIYESRK